MGTWSHQEVIFGIQILLKSLAPSSYQFEEGAMDVNNIWLPGILVRQNPDRVAHSNLIYLVCRSQKNFGHADKIK